MKKKLLTILLLTIICFTSVSTAFAKTTKELAADAATAKEDAAYDAKLKKDHDTLKNLKFDVGDVLSVGGPDSTYFTDKNNAPIVSFILRVIEFATNIMGSIAVIILIVAGFMFMFAQGNQQQLDEAKEVVKYAFIGLALTFFSYIITVFLQSFFITSEQGTQTSFLENSKTQIEEIA
ncbi:hypothetical protein HN709_01475 [Candidatus Peregrinibacteria bacterium]|jgi:hypothetical protein|nr:hypothetical protein [Candidatus Peregrinibacteria bacterium]MBT7736333.1 hypothetical protein [Candidatus Peregrinibacteria bacterium]